MIFVESTLILYFQSATRTHEQFIFKLSILRLKTEPKLFIKSVRFGMTAKPLKAGLPVHMRTTKNMLSTPLLSQITGMYVPTCLLAWLLSSPPLHCCLSYNFLRYQCFLYGIGCITFWFEKDCLQRICMRQRIEIHCITPGRRKNQQLLSARNWKRDISTKLVDIYNWWWIILIVVKLWKFNPWGTNKKYPHERLDCPIQPSTVQVSSETNWWWDFHYASKR